MYQIFCILYFCCDSAIENGCEKETFISSLLFLFSFFNLGKKKKRNSLFFFFTGVFDLSEGKVDRTNKEDTKENKKKKVVKYCNLVYIEIRRLYKYLYFS